MTDSSPIALNGARDSNDDEIHRLKADIAFRRQRVVASVSELRRRVDGVMSWRHWVRSHPFAAAAAAFALGALVGRVGMGSSTTRRR